MAAISLSPFCEYYLVLSSNIRVKGDEMKGENSPIRLRDLVIIFCPTMCSVQRRKLKLLMPVLAASF